MFDKQGIGVSVGRVEGVDKVTGKAIYTADISLPGMLTGKLLLSPVPHARVLNIDTRQAEKLSGVKYIAHAGVFQSVRYGAGVKDSYLFPHERVRYIGEPVAAVAAIDEDIAYEALSLIKVEYEPLEPVFDPLKAILPGAPLIHPDLADYATEYPDAIKFGNVAMWTRASQGNVEKALAGSEFIFEHTFTTPFTHPGSIEPHAVLAQVEGTRRATIWATTQQPFVARATMAEIFSKDINHFRIIVPNLGGGFGGKENLLLEPYAYLLSLQTGKPVKMVLSRDEEFLVSRPRHGSHIELTTGVTKDGKLIGRKAHILYDTGAYSNQGPYVTACGLISVFGPYHIPHRQGEALCVYTNKPAAGAYRGYGFPQGAFASEAQLDLIAAKLGIDPLELRLKNSAEDGDTIITGQPLFSVSIKETLGRAAEASGWKEKRAIHEPNRGIGIAGFIKAAGMGASTAVVIINEDGSVTVLSGTVDIGTGSTTVLAQVVAQELDIPIEKIDVYTADTRSTPYDIGSVASRVVYGMNAIKQAAQQARQKLVDILAVHWECEAGSITCAAGKFFQNDKPEICMTFQEVSTIAHLQHGGPVIGSGSFLAEEGQTVRKEYLKGFPMGPLSHFVYGAQTAEVEVDPRTGQVKVIRLVGAHDVGKALNPLNVAGQIEGGMVMGMSAAIFEQLLFDNGKIANANLVDFKMPTSMDTPQLVSIIVEHPGYNGPYGAKGLGDAVNVATAPAIANAVFHATGVMVHDLPITGEKLAESMEINGNVQDK